MPLFTERCRNSFRLLNQNSRYLSHSPDLTFKTRAMPLLALSRTVVKAIELQTGLATGEEELTWETPTILKEEPLAN